MSASPSSVVALIPVGPGDTDLARVEDLLAALRHHEPLCGTVVLVDDAPSSRHLDRRFATPGLSVHALPHPRKGRGPKAGGVWGALTEGVLTGLGFIHRHTFEPTVLRLDGDSMVLAPFARRLEHRFRQDADVGVLGTVYRNVDGSRRHFSPWHAVTAHLLKRVCRARGDEFPNLPWGLLQTVGGSGRRLRKQVERAFEAGYQAGEHAQGGGYALRRECLRRVAALGCLDRPVDFRGYFLSEDVTVSLFARTAGFRLADFNAPGEVFGVGYRGLPLPPEQLVARGYAVVHSLKHDTVPEDKLRQRFRLLRDLCDSRGSPLPA